MFSRREVRFPRRQRSIRYIGNRKGNTLFCRVHGCNIRTPPSSVVNIYSQEEEEPAAEE